MNENKLYKISFTIFLGITILSTSFKIQNYGLFEAFTLFNEFSILKKLLNYWFIPFIIFTILFFMFFLFIKSNDKKPLFYRIIPKTANIYVNAALYIIFILLYYFIILFILFALVPVFTGIILVIIYNPITKQLYDYLIFNFFPAEVIYYYVCDTFYYIVNFIHEPFKYIFMFIFIYILITMGNILFYFLKPKNKIINYKKMFNSLIITYISLSLIIQLFILISLIYIDVGVFDIIGHLICIDPQIILIIILLITIKVIEHKINKKNTNKV